MPILNPSRYVLLSASLLLFGCSSHSQLSSDVSAPDANAFVSGVDLHRQDEKNQVIRITGAVHHPGTFPVANGQTLSLEEALLLAGGPNSETTFANKASLDKVRVSRLENNAIAGINVDARPGHEAQTFLIKSGDEIFVPESMFPYP